MKHRFQIESFKPYNNYKLLTAVNQHLALDALYSSVAYLLDTEKVTLNNQ